MTSESWSDRSLDGMKPQARSDAALSGLPGGHQPRPMRHAAHYGPCPVLGDNGEPCGCRYGLEDLA
jgi:hypothetical protein